MNSCGKLGTRHYQMLTQEKVKGEVIFQCGKKKKKNQSTRFLFQEVAQECDYNHKSQTIFRIICRHEKEGEK